MSNNIDEKRFDQAMLTWEKYVWKEYKYRHDLCWRLFFKITGVVLILGIIPNLRPEIAQTLKLKELILVPPILASVSAVICIFLMWLELHVFNKIDKKYISLIEIFSKKLNESDLARITSCKAAANQYMVFSLGS